MNFINSMKTELLNLFSFLKFTFMFIAVVWIIGYCIITFYENRFYKNGIPEHIGITHIIKTNSSGFLIREGCGGVIYRITEETAEKINKQGLAFLNQDLHGRGYRDPSERQSYEYYIFPPWQETPYQEPSESEIGTGAGRPVWMGGRVCSPMAGNTKRFLLRPSLVKALIIL